VEQLVLELSKAKGITRRAISDQEILERCIYPMINEGAKILAEGKAYRASDIDIVWLNGYGFPAYRGGPMFYADTVGLRTVVAKLTEQGHAPAALLEKLAGEGKGFTGQF
jgi:3-hydroxyacyl-CoA dehydrogenase